ncbi:MAG TPA: HAD family phosphatase [Caulobacteraceae bacterium]|nr:HAD family phosphatase [Caulobacteraceae bacterium]
MRFPRPVKAVVFDMDGLLINSEVIVRDAMMAVAREMGAELPNEVFVRMVGLTYAASDAVAQAHFGPDFPLEAFNAAVWKRAEQAFEAEDILKAGVREIVDHLEAAGIPRAVCTSSSHETVRRHLAPSGLYDRFQAIVARGDYAHGKPSPDPYLLAAERLGVAPADCLALEDSHNGVRAAHAAGAMTIMVPDLLDPTPEMRRLCIAIAESLHDVREALAASH